MGRLVTRRPIPTIFWDYESRRPRVPGAIELGELQRYLRFYSNECCIGAIGCAEERRTSKAPQR